MGLFSKARGNSIDLSRYQSSSKQDNNQEVNRLQAVLGPHFSI